MDQINPNWQLWAGFWQWGNDFNRIFQRCIFQNPQISRLHSAYNESRSLGTGPGNLHLTSLLSDSDPWKLAPQRINPYLGSFLSESSTPDAQAISCCPVTQQPMCLGSKPGLGISWEAREEEALFMKCFLVRASILPSNTFQFIQFTIFLINQHLWIICYLSIFRNETTLNNISCKKNPLIIVTIVLKHVF